MFQLAIKVYVIFSLSLLFVSNADAGISVVTYTRMDGQYDENRTTLPGQWISSSVGDGITSSHSYGMATEGHLGVKANIIHGIGKQSIASVSSKFDDAFVIKGGPLPLGQNLREHGPISLGFYFTGNLNGIATTFSNAYGTLYDGLQGTLDFTLNLSAGNGQVTISESNVGVPTAIFQKADSGPRPLFYKDYSYGLSVPAIPVDPQTGRFNYNGSLRIRRLFSIYGTWTANFGETLELTSITFEDGMTPEELGYSIEFDSGRLSPNIQENVVPEPTSLALFGFGIFGSGMILRRRSRGI